MRLRDSRALPRAAQALESPYDVDARFRTKRASAWTGYHVVHLSETSDEGDAPHLITHIDTTPATAHEATRTDAIRAALAAKALAPAQHLVDAAYERRSRERRVAGAEPHRARHRPGWAPAPRPLADPKRVADNISDAGRQVLAGRVRTIQKE